MADKVIPSLVGQLLNTSIKRIGVLLLPKNEMIVFSTIFQEQLDA